MICQTSANRPITRMLRAVKRFVFIKRAPLYERLVDVRRFEREAHKRDHDERNQTDGDEICYVDIDHFLILRYSQLRAVPASGVSGSASGSMSGLYACNFSLSSKTRADKRAAASPVR